MVIFAPPKPEGTEKRRQPGTPVVQVIGLGSAGIHFVNLMIVERIRGARMACLDTDVEALRQSLAPRNLLIGPELRQGTGTNCDPCLARKAAQESRQEILELLSGAEMLVLVGGLGGGLSCGAAAPVARMAREAGVQLILGLLTLPSRREGKVRRTYAERALPILEGAMDTTILFSNDRLNRDPMNQPPTVSADRGAEEIVRAFSGILELLFRCDRMRVDFADLRACLGLRGYGSLSMGMASGPDRARQAAQGALASPLMQGQFLEQAETVLVQMKVGQDMPLVEIDRAMRLLADRCGGPDRLELSLNQEAGFDGLARCVLLAACSRRPDARVPVLPA